MPVQLYETLFLIDSTKLAAEPDTVRATLHTAIEKHHGKIEVTRPWDDRKLTYPIQKQKKGSFHIIYYRLESRTQIELDREFKLNEHLLRWMTIHIPGKWEGAMLDVAHNDHGAAFALRGIQDEPSPTDGTPVLNLGEGGVLPMGEAVAAATGGRRPRPRDLAEKPDLRGQPSLTVRADRRKLLAGGAAPTRDTPSPRTNPGAGPPTRR